MTHSPSYERGMKAAISGLPTECLVSNLEWIAEELKARGIPGDEVLLALADWIPAAIAQAKAEGSRPPAADDEGTRLIRTGADVQ